MGTEEIQAFLTTYLASDRTVSTSTQNQALSAVIFLYRHVVKKEIEFPFTSFAIPLPRIYYKMVTTSARFKNYWVTKM